MSTSKVRLSKSCHGTRDVACLLAGNGGGLLRRTGRQVQFPNNTSLSNLWLTLTQLTGIQRREFGENLSLVKFFTNNACIALPENI